MDISELIEPPTKKVKLSSTPPNVEAEESSTIGQPLATSAADNNMDVVRNSDDTSKELEVGITSFVQQKSPGFKGTLKKRYTDFLVNEVLPNGEVLHLRNLKVTRPIRGQEQDKIPQAHPQANNASSSPLEASSLRSANDAKKSWQNPGAETSVPQESEDQKTKVQSEVKPEEKIEGGSISSEDKSLLTTYFGEASVEKLINLYQKILSSPDARGRDIGIVKADFTSDRSVRGQIHHSIRRIFNGKVDSSTDHDGMLVLSATLAESRRPANQPGRNQWKRDNRPARADRGGDHLHFTLYKENKDTMEVIHFLKNQLKTNAKTFQFAGTKDRRAVTVQRVSAYRIEAERLAGVNKVLRNSAIGDYEYQKHGLDLGDLTGNEFVTTLRDCYFEFDANISSAERVELAKKTVEDGLTSLRERGFFNYYGLQRFGTFATRTDTVGIKMLQGNFKAACDDILDFNPRTLAAAQDSESIDFIGSDDKARAQAINVFRTTGQVNEALDKLPRKFSAEANVMRHLGKHPSDYAGALMMIQRNMRLMYVHAYQSLVWNMAVGERWRLYGDEVVKGDLVMVNEHKEKKENGLTENATSHEQVDADGELVVQPSFEDKSHAIDDVFERARPLTAQEAASGEYTIFDVVLPQPGFDIMYPNNAMDEWYKTFMGSEQGGGLDPYDMRRKQNDYSLSGSYRKILARIEPSYSAEVRAYADENEQFVQTDLALLKENGSTSSEHISAPEEGDKLAVVLKFQLRSSQYATMALRELSKGGIVQHKPDFSGGR